MSKICDMDCFNCKYDDCINDTPPPKRKPYSKFSEESKQRCRERQNRYVAAAKAKGLCMRCRKRPITHWGLCVECYYKQKRYNAAQPKKRDNWQREGKCFWCGRDPIPGKKVCEIHYEYLKKTAEHARSSPKAKEAQRKFGEWFWKTSGTGNNKNAESTRRDRRA
ncbi:MAG: hypothetical protein NC084_09815 [Bacteroides sp.]|nr:hypothetical protein [Eubacterium sp.]MCM1419419.1 hypothetical protein [Roseburia sp.]MCM1462994.1 hypothetical protein [Bacteroides sp.]